MASKIGGIAIGLTANIGSFVRSMNTASGAVDKFGDKAKKSKASVSSMSAGVVAGAVAIGSAVGTFVGNIASKAVSVFVNGLKQAAHYSYRLFESQREVIDRLAKFSRELGFSVFTLQKFQLAAKLSGTPVIDLEKGLQILTRRIGEAAAGTGEGRKAFLALGLSVEQLTNMKPEQAFFEIQDRISRMANETDRAATAFMIFSRQGVNLLNFLNDGTKETANNFERIGALITSMGGNFEEEGPKSIKAVEMMNDRLEEISAAFSYLVQGIIVQVAPAVAFLASILLHATNQFKDRGGLAAVVVDKLKASIISTAKGVQSLGVILGQTTANVLDFIAPVALFFGTLTSIFATVIYIIETIADLIIKVTSTVAELLFGVATLITSTLSVVGKGVTNLYDLITGKITFSEMTKLGKRANDVFLAQNKETVDRIGGVWKDFGKVIPEGYAQMIGNASDTMKDGYEGILSLSDSVYEKTVSLGMVDVEGGIDDFVNRANENMEKLIGDTPEAKDPFAPIRESAEETKNFVADTFKQGELGLLVTDSLATDLSFLEKAKKGMEEISDIDTETPGPVVKFGGEKGGSSVDSLEPVPEELTEDQKLANWAEGFNNLGTVKPGEDQGLSSDWANGFNNLGTESPAMSPTIKEPAMAGESADSSGSTNSILKEILQCLRGGIPATVG